MPFPDAFWTLTGCAALAAGAMLAVWALRGDRSRGRKRCPRCWYDMSGTAGLTCPECGRTVQHESSLHRTRRNRHAAVAASLMLTLGLWTLHGPLLSWNTWAGVLPIAAWEVWVPLMDPDAAAEIESTGLPTVTPGAGRAENVRAAYRLALVLDGKADPAKSGIPGWAALGNRSGPVITMGSPWEDPQRVLRQVHPTDTECALRIAALAQLRDLRSITMPRVHRLMRDPSAPVEVRLECLRTIRAVEGEAPAAAVLADLAAADPVVAMRGGLLWAHQHELWTDDGVLAVFVAAARDQDASIRWFALQRIGAESHLWKHEHALSVIIAAADDADPEVRRLALDVLGSGGEHARSAVETIRRISLSDPDRLVQMAATAALDRIERGGEIAR